VQPNSGDRVLYLYGVIPCDQEVPRGDGIALASVSHGALKAVVEPVSALEFSPALLDQKLQSLDWVAVIARKHEAVLEQAMCHGAVIPARLCTLFSRDDAVKRTLVEHHDRFLATLSRLKGREEWGLKVFCDDARLKVAVTADNPDLQDDEAAMAAASPGHAFVLRKKHEARLEEMALAHLDALLDQIIEGVEHVSDDVRVRAILPASATEGSDPMVLNLAALVNVTNRAAFIDAVSEMQTAFSVEGLTCELTGPWAAYSFCDDAGERGHEVAQTQEG
jgi:hypothetical protein